MGIVRTHRRADSLADAIRSGVASGRAVGPVEMVVVHDMPDRAVIESTSGTGATLLLAASAEQGLVITAAVEASRGGRSSRP